MQSLPSPSHKQGRQHANRVSEFCDRKYSNVSFRGGANNSPLDGSYQKVSVPGQLDLGVRSLNAEGYDQNGEVGVRYKDCPGTTQEALECKGTPETFLQKIDGFLIYNTEEALTLRPANGDKQTARALIQASNRLKNRDAVGEPGGC